MSYQEVQSSGAKIYISSSPGGVASLEILGAIDIGELGPQSQTIDVTTLRDLAKKKVKAALADYGKVSVGGIRSNQDAGQQALDAAARYSGVTAYNFKVTLPDGTTTPTTFTFSANVTNFKTAPGKPNDVVRFKAELEITGPVTETLPT